MPISLRTLERAAARPHVELARSMDEAVGADLRTAFLSHSHHDARYAQGVAAMLADAGLDAYIDWEDAAMPSRPDQRTAERIKDRIAACDLFIFLATPESRGSKWCPWEIGLADGLKNRRDILLVQTADDLGRHYGSEYLGLYRRIDLARTGELAVFRPGSSKTRVLVESL